ncbi:LOW QUALITY PROTEIN: uncharacterized protein ACIGJ3_001640 [Trichechus inunguis]
MPGRPRLRSEPPLGGWPGLARACWALREAPQLETCGHRRLGAGRARAPGRTGWAAPEESSPGSGPSRKRKLYSASKNQPVTEPFSDLDPTPPTCKPSSSHVAPKKQVEQWVRCAYFTKVSTVKGVAVEWETDAAFSHTENTPLIFEAELSNESSISPPLSITHTRSQVSSVRSWEEEAEAETPELVPEMKEEEEEDDNNYERPRAVTPEWLMTREHGFRCMACCRVFPSREAILEHAQHGVREGFSCRVFYEEMLEMRRPASEPWRPRRKDLMGQHRQMVAIVADIEKMQRASQMLQEQLDEETQQLQRLEKELSKMRRREKRQREAPTYRHPHPRGKRLKRSHQMTLRPPKSKQ